MTATAKKTDAKDINQSLGEKVGPNAVRVQRLMPASPEKLWEYLIDDKKRAMWQSAGHIEPKLGGKVELRFEPENLTPHKEEMPADFKDSDCLQVKGEVIRFEPPRALGYTWLSGSKSSEVLFELEPQGSGTLLTVTHSKVSNRDGMVSVAGGWHIHLGILLDKLSGQTPQPFWASHEKLRAVYEAQIKA